MDQSVLSRDLAVGPAAIAFAGQHFEALPCGALFWPDQALLLVADLHLEKGSSAAARGWLLPPYDSLDTLLRLERAIERTGARGVVALGDSFHDADGHRRLSAAARACLDRLVAGRHWIWIAGNHDGADGAPGETLATLAIAGVRLSHHADGAAPGISGHYHPVARLRLRTGRSVRRRCFALGGARLILPAYGAYAGGLCLSDPAFGAVLGHRRHGIVPTAAGLIHITEEDRT
jgi:DNA ligase-associated metallophosphoesterase